MAKIGFTGHLDDEPEGLVARTPNDHEVYSGYDHVNIKMKAGNLTAEHLTKLVDLTYDDGTGERVLLDKVAHFHNKPGGRERGTSNYEDNEPLTQLIITRNGDTRSIVMRSTDLVDVRMR